MESTQGKLRQKEKEAEKAAEAFFERARQYEGQNGLFEAQQVYEKMSFLKRILWKSDKNIQATSQAFHAFAQGCREKGEEAQQEAARYAEEGLQIAIAHPEVRDQNDNIAIARIEFQRKEELKREKERKKAEERAQKRLKLEKQYGAAVRKLILPQALGVANSYPEYGLYLDRLQAATPEQHAVMMKELQYAEKRYEIQELFYSVVQLTSRDTSISGRQRVRDEMLKQWDSARPEQRKQMEDQAKEFVKTNEFQKNRNQGYSR